jgi:sugar lactone lactonase YvrE
VIKRLSTLSRFLFCSILVSAGIFAQAQAGFGSVNLGSSAQVTVTVTLPAAATVGTVSVVTEGIANLDFTNAGGGSCAAGKSYAGAACTVEVTFKPTTAGPRHGAVVLAGAGGVIATEYLTGIGSGPLMAFLPPSQTAVVAATTKNPVKTVAVDAAGNLYVVESGATQVLKETLSNGKYTQTAIGSGLNAPQQMAVDGAGNLFIADPGFSGDETSGSLFKETPANGTYVQTRVPTLYGQPLAVSVDGAGNLFVFDFAYFYKFAVNPDGSYTQTQLPFPDLPEYDSVGNVAVDGSGNLYLGISYEYYPSGQTQPAPATGIFIYAPSASGYTITERTVGSNEPCDFALDGSANIYVTCQYTYDSLREKSYPAFAEKLSSTNTYANVSLGTYAAPLGLTVDSHGNVYVADAGTQIAAGAVYRVGFAGPPVLSYAATPMGSVIEGSYITGTPPSSPQIVTILNNGNAPLEFAKVSYPADFAPYPFLDAEPANECVAGGSVAGGATCNLAIDFKPVQPLNGKSTQVVSESVTLTASAPALPSEGTILVSGIETRPTGALTLFPSVDPYPYPQLAPVTFTARIAGVAGLPAPTGSIVFNNSGTGKMCIVPVTNGLASCASSGIGGSQQIAATYSGDSTYAESTAWVQMEVVQPALPATAQGVSLGTVKIGATSGAVPVKVTFASTETLTGIGVVTLGGYNLEFNQAAGGNCATGTTYTAGETCTVNVTFKPRTPGLAVGAVQVDGPPGYTPVNAYISGMGVGPQTVFLPGTQKLLASGVDGPAALAVDATGRLYVAAQGSLMQETAAGSGTFTQVYNYSTYCVQGVGIALDGAGNLAVASGTCNDGYLYLYTGPGGTYNFFGSGYTSPNAVAVDGTGSFYVADSATGIIYKETPSGGVYTQTVVAAGLSSPLGVAVDASGNVYVADFGTLPDGAPGAVFKLTLQPNGSYIQSKIGSGWVSPSGVAVDGMGSVYVADYGSSLNGGSTQGAVVKETPGGGGYSQAPIGSGWIAPTAVALDASGNLYVADAGDDSVYELDFADPPALNFDETQLGATSSDSPRTVTVENAGNAPLMFPVPQSGSNPSIGAEFALESSVGSACPVVSSSAKSAGTLAAGNSCELSISFKPAATGVLSGELVVTDNSLDAASPGYNKQTLKLRGTGTLDAQTIEFERPASPLTYGDSPITLTATASSGLPVTFSVTGPATIDGNKMKITGAGTVTVTATQPGGGNYAAAPAVRHGILVNKAWLTVTAASLSMKQGAAVPPLTAGITGFVDGDDLATAVKGEPILSTSATSKSKPGKYTITVKFGTLESANYWFALVYGTLTVTP